jgi:4-hydroxybenzoate polyprenyltransferase
MRCAATDMDFGTIRQHLFNEQARRGFRRPGGGCGHINALAQKRPSTSRRRDVISKGVNTASVPDSEHSGLTALLPPTLRAFALLARFDRPIGWWLLFWPCVFGLALSGGLIAEWHLALWMLLGAIAMRGAGCVYNDIVDRDLDRQVARTANRPLASGVVSRKAAWAWLLILALVGLVVLLQLKLNAQLLALESLLLVAAYPFMKRITWWPQVWLGLVFSWGALVGWIAVAEHAHPAMFWLYGGTICWVIGYDTIYAMQDREDDAMIGIRSSALRLGGHIRSGVAIFYALALVGWALAIWNVRPQGQALIALLPVAIHLALQVITLKADGSNALAAFRSNRMAGFLMALGCLVVGAAS